MVLYKIGDYIWISALVIGVVIGIIFAVRIYKAKTHGDSRQVKILGAQFKQINKWLSITVIIGVAIMVFAFFFMPK